MKMFDAGKTRMIHGEKNCDDMLSRFLSRTSRTIANKWCVLVRLRASVWCTGFIKHIL